MVIRAQVTLKAAPPSKGPGIHLRVAVNSLGASDLTEAKKGPEIQCGCDMQHLGNMWRFWPLNVLSGTQKKVKFVPMKLKGGTKYSP